MYGFLLVFLPDYYNKYMMAKKRTVFRRAVFAAQQNSTAVLPYIPRNEHRAKDYILIILRCQI